jgi:hypothetical protein
MTVELEAPAACVTVAVRERVAVIDEAKEGR